MSGLACGLVQTGRTIPVAIGPNDTVADVKRKIQDVALFPADTQRLYLESYDDDYELRQVCQSLH